MYEKKIHCEADLLDMFPEPLNGVVVSNCSECWPLHHQHKNDCGVSSGEGDNYKFPPWNYDSNKDIHIDNHFHQPLGQIS